LVTQRRKESKREGIATVQGLLIQAAFEIYFLFFSCVFASLRQKKAIG